MITILKLLILIFLSVVLLAL